jgi:hypothetical protein
MNCVCKSSTSFHGLEAQRYAKEHLVEVEVDVNNWITYYICPDTGVEWMTEHPYPESHGGGPINLVRKIDNIQRK